MKQLTKKQRREIYEKSLNYISKNMSNTGNRICLYIRYDLFNNKFRLYEIEKNIPEFLLFAYFVDNEYEYSVSNKFNFYLENNANELRVFALQLCIEMTK